MATTTEILAQLREKEVLIATSKYLTLVYAVAMLGLKPEKVRQFEPELEREKNGQTFPAEQEPKSDDPIDAVKFKILRAVEYLEEHANELTILAGDVVFKVKKKHADSSEHYHRLVRYNGDVVEEEEYPVSEHFNELESRYCDDAFTAEWHVGFGTYEQGQERYGKVIVEADYPQLSTDQVHAAYNPLTSAGIELLELSLKLPNISFRLKTSDDDRGTVITRELAEQLIVKKVPTIEMIAQLLAAEIDTNPQEYSLIFNSLVN